MTTMSRVLHLLTVPLLCARVGMGQAGDGEDCGGQSVPPKVEDVHTMCDLARQLRALETASQSAVTAVVAFAREASEAKERAEKAVGRAKSKNRGVDVATEAAARAGAAAQRAETAVSDAKKHAANLTAVSKDAVETTDESLRLLATCEKADEPIRTAAEKCTGAAADVTSKSLESALNAFAELVPDDADEIREHGMVFVAGLKSLEDDVRMAGEAKYEAEKAEGDASDAADGARAVLTSGCVLSFLAAVHFTAVL
uniref:Glutamic acid/alanine-rich protein n=1 Tax=Trypanosoma congolense TaxID=5692 RepID=Q9U9D1_TRYCO|nr:glutamic acid/alanine-rich protein [Trypanosoma congolense]